MAFNPLRAEKMFEFSAADNMTSYTAWLLAAMVLTLEYIDIW